MAEIGRPSEYKEEYILKVDDYLNNCQDEVVAQTKQEGDRNVIIKTKVNLPTIRGFALFIDRPEKTLYAWADENIDFRKSLDKIKTEQEKRLLNNGLSGDYNPTIAKLILSSNHGYREKTEQDITSGGEALQPIMVKFLDDKPTEDNKHTIGI